jgi:hypothetical protein
MTFPPIDFPVYGVDQRLWQGPRWLDSVEGELGAPAWAIWLHHGFTTVPDATRPWVRVGSHPRERHARLMTPQGGDPVREVAFAALFSLANLTLPAPQDRPQADGYLRRLVEYVEARADRYADWPVATWRIHDTAVGAHVHHWAGAWAGFTTELADIAVAALGHRVPVGAVELTEVVDSTAYHFDSREPIPFPGACEESRTAALGENPCSEATDVRWPLTADHWSPLPPGAEG